MIGRRLHGVLAEKYCMVIFLSGCITLIIMSYSYFKSVLDTTYF